MRNKSAAVQGGRGGSQSKSAAEIPDVAAPAAISLATRVGLLAPGGPAPLPPLDDVRSRYSIYTGKKTLFRLCQNLVEEGLATTRSWEKSKADPLAFIDESLRRWCFLHGISRIEAEFQEFSFAIRDEGTRQLSLSVQHWHLGHFVCRAPLTALEEYAKGLGAAFYHLLAYTLVRSLGSWDLDDAAASVEQMKEWAGESREEEGGAGEEFEIPDLDACTPAFIKEARKNHLSIRHGLRILRAHSNGPFELWIKSLLRMYGLTRIPNDKRLREDPEEAGYDYLRPVPATVLSFDEQDAIVATVSEVNVVRQPFSHVDIGSNKAMCLVGRINMFWGFGWKAIPRAFGEETAAAPECDLLISCVDTRKARHLISQSFKKFRAPAYHLDLGNDASSGQYVLGQPFDVTVSARTQAARLPTVFELYPEIADVSIRESSLPSCSAVDALDRQEPFINQTLAVSALAMLSRLLRYGQISYHGGFYNAETGRMATLTVDPDRFAKLRRAAKKQASNSPVCSKWAVGQSG